MNTHFKSALSKVTAEDNLVEKTEKFLRATLNNPQQGKASNLKKRSGRPMKKLLLAMAAAVILFIGSFAGAYTYMKSPVAYISLDINPSVELGVNALNKVVSVEGINEEGKEILQGKSLINVEVTDALSQLVDSAADKNYINDDGSTVISITAESKNEKKAEKLTEICEEAVNGSISEKEVNAVVYKDCSEPSLRKEAKELGISPGKLKLIKSVQALDPSITVEELKEAKVSDIMLKANEVITAIESETGGSELSESQKQIIEKLKKVVQNKGKRVRDAVKDRFESAKEQAKSAFEDAKRQAKDIKENAKEKAKELRKQANELLKNMDGMSEDDKEAAIAKAKELRNQADSLIQEAEKQFEELKESAKKQRDEAIESAKKIRDAAKSNNDNDEKDKDDDKEDKTNSNKKDNGSKGNGKGLENKNNNNGNKDKANNGKSNNGNNKGNKIKDNYKEDETDFEEETSGEDETDYEEETSYEDETDYEEETSYEDETDYEEETSYEDETADEDETESEEESSGEDESASEDETDGYGRIKNKKNNGNNKGKNKK